MLVCVCAQWYSYLQWRHREQCCHCAQKVITIQVACWREFEWFVGEDTPTCTYSLPLFQLSPSSYLCYRHQTLQSKPSLLVQAGPSHTQALWVACSWCGVFLFEMVIAGNHPNSAFHAPLQPVSCSRPGSPSLSMIPPCQAHPPASKVRLQASRASCQPYLHNPST